MDINRFGRITTADTMLLLIDIQEKFVPHIFEIDRVIRNSVIVSKGCRISGIPIVITEQYPEGLGRTVPDLAEACGECRPFEKTAFSAFEDTAIFNEIKRIDRPNILLAGIEAHVCLIKTALDAIDLGYSIHWLVDCISSRTAANAETAFTRAVQCGAFASSAEMALFQLMESSSDANFRSISKLVK
ncbi:MAG TPA: hydrolase [bacterium]|nr:hydrolase [bacterium]